MALLASLSHTPGDRDLDFAIGIGNLAATLSTGGGASAPLALTGVNAATRVVTFAAIPANACNATPCVLTVTYRPALFQVGDAPVFKIASPLTFAEAQARTAWAPGVPRDSGISNTAPNNVPNGLYDNFDLKGVVDNQTLSSADYNWDFNTRLLTLVNSTPLAGTENVVVTYKRTEFDGSLNAAGTSIRTPFWASVTATAGPNFAAQQAVGVFSATSLTGFVDPCWDGQAFSA